MLYARAVRKARCRSTVVASVFLVGFIDAGNALAEPYPIAAANPVEVKILAEENRPAWELATRAERVLEAGQLEKAADLYAQSRLAAPRSGFVPRRHCELLIALGRKEQAVEACGQALRHGGNVVDLRVNVAALTSGPGLPTVDEIINAIIMADGAQTQLPGKPWGYAAWADIGRRIGDQEMMQINLAALDRLAPEHHETLRAKALAPRSFRWLKTVGWATLGLIGLVAALRSLSRAARKARLRPDPQVALLAVTVVGLLTASPTLAGATQAPAGPVAPLVGESLGDMPINKADPEKSIPTPEQANRNPVQFAYWLMDMAGQAEDAEQKKNWRGAIKYYRALAKAVPEKSITYAKICRAYEELGERANGLQACRDALGRQGARADDYSRYVRLLLDHNGVVTANERAEVTQIMKHLRSEASNSLEAEEIQCFLGVRTQDVKMLESCVTALIAAAPYDPRTVAYHWALATAKGNFDEAAGLLERAKSAGVKPERIAEMEATIASGRTRQRLPMVGGAILGATGLAFLFIRKRTAGSSSRPKR